MTRWILMVAVSIAIIIGAILSVILPPASSNITINDVSWPNCYAVPNTTWGVVGVTGGLDFRPNSCLAHEASQFTHYALYMNTGYPGISYGKRLGTQPQDCSANNKLCWAYNYGYSAALYAIRYANSQGVHSRLWWLDVETENSWTNSARENIASIQGAINAVRQNVFVAKVGLYSYPGQWAVLTNNWHNGLLSWVATGSSSRSLAVAACRGQSFTGGSAVLTQYTLSLDINYPCAQSFLSIWQK